MKSSQLKLSRFALKASALLVFALGPLSSSDAASVEIGNWSFEGPEIEDNTFHAITTATGEGWTSATSPADLGVVISGTKSGYSLQEGIPDGKQFYALFPARDLVQKLTFPTPGKYEISYWVAGRDEGGKSGYQDYEVSIDGKVIKSDSTHTAQPFTNITEQFTIDEAGEHDLTFLSVTETGDHATFLDAIQIKAVP